MKKIILLLVVVSLSSVSFGLLTGTGHDFGSSTWAGNMACVPCHFPHKASGTGGPLWDHVSSSETDYVMYSSTTWMGGTTQADQVLSAESKLCMSCHDGSVNLDAYGSEATGSTNISTINGGVADLGRDLSASHPIGFSYAAARTDAGVANYVADPSGTLPLNAIPSLTITDAVGCNSCHEPHGKGQAAGLLRVSGATLCTTCHIK